MKIRLLLTFDYELYFGENYLSEEKVLFSPTQKLLDLAKKKEIRLVFFIDIVSIIAYKKNKKYKYIEEFTKQIKLMKSLGHDMQMHFHPHWIDSIYNETSQKWVHKYKNWSYSNLIDNFGKIGSEKIFNEAQDLFIDITKITPIAFRAGGYTIQPKEQELIELLSRLNYKYDSSVIPYRKFISNAQVFDFLNVEKMNYWNVNSKTFLQKGKVKLIEIPVLSVEKEFSTMLKYSGYKLINKFIPSKVFKKRGKGATLKPLEYKNNSLSVSFDMLQDKDKKILNFITAQYIEKFKDNNVVYLNILSHPKAMSDDSLDVMEDYIDYMLQEYNCEFIGFDELDV